MNVEALIYQINQTADEVSVQFGLSPGISKILLHQFKWNASQLKTSFLAAKSRAEFLRKHRIYDLKLNMVESIADCTICLDEKLCFGLEICGHYFCQACWEEYIKTGVSDEKNWMLTCPILKCDTVLNEEFIITMAPHLYDKYLKAQVDSFVTTSGFKCCPMPECGRVVGSPAQIPKSKRCDLRIRPSTFIQCSCGTEFCPDCHEESHVPASCQLLKEWAVRMKSTGQDLLTSNWLKINSKKCPQCTISIQKDGGCNHMTCRNSTCRFEWCWLCMRPWRGHGSSCEELNPITESESTTFNNNRKPSLAKLYDNYITMYNAFELKLRKNYFMDFENTIQQRVNRLIEDEVKDMQPLFKSIKALKDAQKLITHSCIFGYYIADVGFEQSNQFISEVNKLRTMTETFERKLLYDPISNSVLWLEELNGLAVSVENCCKHVIVEVPNLSEPPASICDMISGLIFAFLIRIGNLFSFCKQIA